MAKAISEAGANELIRVIVLKSAGERAFCAGASFDELTKIENSKDGKSFFSGFAHVINAIREAPKFVIARVQGKAVGGGVGLASAADICFATQHASIKLSELAVGIGPFVVGPAVERKIGLSAMSILTIDAQSWYTAEWAENKGLYAKIFETIEEMDTHLAKLATTLSMSNPEAIHALKKIFWAEASHWESLLIERAEVSGHLVTSDFTRAAIAKFKAGTR